MPNVNVKFKVWDTIVRREEYANGRTALVLVDALDGSPIATASVNLPDVELAEDEVCIKDYSENEGMLDALVREGIVSETVRHVPSGFVTIPICKLL